MLTPSHASSEFKPTPPLSQITQGLTSLVANHNPLTTHPAGLQHLQRVRYLNLAATGLHAFPPFVAMYTGLEELVLASNQLHGLPPYLNRFPRLAALDLSDNALSAIPPAVGFLSSLETLNVASNHLLEFPHELLALAPTLQVCV